MASETPPLPTKYPQQEELLSQEFITYLSTLPKQEGWGIFDLYRYQGFWYLASFLHRVLSCQRHFHPQPSDVLLVTTPKSGTTWLKSIIFTLLNRGRHPLDANHPLLNTNPHDLVLHLEIDLYRDSETPDLTTIPSPRLFATHMPWVALPEPVRVGSDCKIVCLCRNPKDTFVSLWHFVNRLGLPATGTISIEEAFDLFINGSSAYGPYWDHVAEYWKRSRENPERILFLTYEDMKEKPGMHLRCLAEFLDCPFEPGEEESGLVEKILELCSFENLSSLEVNRNGELSNGSVQNHAFFRQGKVGDWKNYLTDEMVQKLDQITKEKFSESGLFLKQSQKF